MLTEDDRPKPLELVNLHVATAEAFNMLQEEFNVPLVYELNLHNVDAAENVLRKTVEIAAIAMRQIQFLRWVTKPGVETTNDVVVGLAADLWRALDYLVRRCADEAKSDSLTEFQRQVAIAARRAGGDGGIATLR